MFNMGDKNIVSKEKVNEAILLLGKSFNDPKPHHIEQSIEILRSSIQNSKSLEAVRADQVKIPKADFIKSGATWFDDWLRGGVRLGELVLYGAMPSIGKTHLLTWTGAQFLLEGYRVLTVVGEDLLSDVRDYYTLAVGNQSAMENLWLADMQDVRFGVREIEILIEDLKAKETPPEIVVIDHVDLIKGSGVSSTDDWKAVSDIMVNLKLLAKKNKIVIVTASQALSGKELHGLQRLYRAKIGKAGNADIIIMADSIIDSEYELSLEKARGRKAVTMEQKKKTLICDWDNMTIEEI